MMGQEMLSHAKQLVEDLESGNEPAARTTLDGLARLRETDLFRELGKLTRDLHDALNNFRLDSRICDLAAQDIPDAKERLNYVITMTEQAANKTLTAVEESLPVADELQQRSAELKAQWEQFRRREMSAEQFRDLSHQLDEFFVGVEDHAKVLQTNLSDVLMAQDFQDLTGQIIRRVIGLVQDVEESLVELIRISGHAQNTMARTEAVDESAVAASGPMVPGVDDGDSRLQGQDDVDELLSSLGF